MWTPWSNHLQVKSVPGRQGKIPCMQRRLSPLLSIAQIERYQPHIGVWLQIAIHPAVVEKGHQGQVGE